MYPYPPQFPVDEFNLIIGALRGKVPSLAEGMHAGWVVVGYGLLQTNPVVPDIALASPTFGRVEAASELQRVVDVYYNQPGLPFSLISIPWKTIIPIVFRLIEELLNNSGG